MFYSLFLWVPRLNMEAASLASRKRKMSSANGTNEQVTPKKASKLPRPTESGDCGNVVCPATSDDSPVSGTPRLTQGNKNLGSVDNGKGPVGNTLLPQTRRTGPSCRVKPTASMVIKGNLGSADDGNGPVGKPSVETSPPKNKRSVGSLQNGLPESGAKRIGLATKKTPLPPQPIRRTRPPMSLKEFVLAPTASRGVKKATKKNVALKSRTSAMPTVVVPSETKANSKATKANDQKPEGTLGAIAAKNEVSSVGSLDIVISPSKKHPSIDSLQDGSPESGTKESVRVMHNLFAFTAVPNETVEEEEERGIESAARGALSPEDHYLEQPPKLIYCVVFLVLFAFGLGIFIGVVLVQPNAQKVNEWLGFGEPSISPNDAWWL
jgi:hypothetical protein